MPYDPTTTSTENNATEKKGVFGVIVHSFFVVPFLLAVLCVLLFAAVHILTMEKHSVQDYLADIKKGGIDKRWQAAFELSRILSNPKEVPQDQQFVDGMITAYQASSHDDERVRQYLILAMGRSGRREFADILLKDLSQEKDENVYAIITALGILKSVKAIDVILKYLDHDNPRIRLASVISLGQIGAPLAKTALIKKLDDPEVNVSWDAAIALAKMDDRSGKGLVLKLLDRDYLKQYPNLSSENTSKVMMVAINATGAWRDADINERLKKLFSNDPNMNVRALAHQVLEKQ